MIINNQMVVSQEIWDRTPQEVKDAEMKCDPAPLILSNEEWAELDEMILSRVRVLKSRKQATTGTEKNEGGYLLGWPRKPAINSFSFNSKSTPGQ